MKMEAKKKLTLTSSLNFVLPHRPKDRKWRLHPSNWSSWLRPTRVCAWVLRFVQNYRSPRQQRLSESLIIREAQLAAFTEEYRALQENKLISKKSRLKTLVPLLDEDGLIRRDGRAISHYPPKRKLDNKIDRKTFPRGWTSRLRNKPHPCKLVHQILDTSSTRRNSPMGK